MVVIKKSSWIGLILAWRGSVLPKIWVRLLVTVGAATVVTIAREFYEWRRFTLTPIPFTLIGLALGIFLGFRNNTSYDRFWEGRKLWGGVVNATRTLARRTLTLVDAGDGFPSEEQIGIVRRIVAYTHSLRLHLRSETDLSPIGAYLSSEELVRLERRRNKPIAILQDLGERFRRAWKEGRIETYHLPTLEESLAELTSLQGGCERIKGTPIPFSYTVLIHRIVAIYCFALPFGIADTVHRMTPFVVAIVSYAFFGLDAIGDEIEEPFGFDPNDLPLSQISRTIEIDLLQSIGESTVPEPLVAQDGILA